MMTMTKVVRAAYMQARSKPGSSRRRRNTTDSRPLTTYLPIVDALYSLTAGT